MAVALLPSRAEWGSRGRKESTHTDEGLPESIPLCQPPREGSSRRPQARSRPWGSRQGTTVGHPTSGRTTLMRACDPSPLTRPGVPIAASPDSGRDRGTGIDILVDVTTRPTGSGIDQMRRVGRNRNSNQCGRECSRGDSSLDPTFRHDDSFRMINPTLRSLTPFCLGCGI